MELWRIFWYVWTRNSSEIFRNSSEFFFQKFFRIFFRNFFQKFFQIFFQKFFQKFFSEIFSELFFRIFFRSFFRFFSEIFFRICWTCLIKFWRMSPECYSLRWTEKMYQKIFQIYISQKRTRSKSKTRKDCTIVFLFLMV